MCSVGCSGKPPRPAPQLQRRAPAMNNDAATIQWEDRFTDDEREIANMDEFDFMTLLMESRIIQAS